MDRGPEVGHAGERPGTMNERIDWMSTKEAAEHLGITLRSLYRFIDEGSLPAYRFGRVIRLKHDDVDRFIETCRIEPGSLEHLYPELKGAPARDVALGD
ncbi:MAG: helix-turn-helix domain-containing protein [Actinomycetota bacterium]|nr:helix-turn-helix domain-containing protein [Actinomycetota bacterium]